MIRKMWKYTFIALILIDILNLQAEQAESGIQPVYELKENILYYPEDSVGTDDYRRERCRIDLYLPRGIENFATVVWFHGGGLKGGDRFIPEVLKNRKIAVAAAGYRLYPRVKCPDYLTDAAAAVAWVKEHIQEYGGDTHRVFVAGFSAGGYLTSMIALDKKWLGSYGVDPDSMAGFIPLSGHTITHFTVREERGIPGQQPFIDEYAPLYHVRANAPPLVLITGDRNLELLGRYEENAYLMRMMKVAGHQHTTLYELQGFDHGGMMEPGLLILCNYVEQRMKELSRQPGE